MNRTGGYCTSDAMPAEVCSTPLGAERKPRGCKNLTGTCAVLCSAGAGASDNIDR